MYNSTNLQFFVWIPWTSVDPEPELNSRLPVRAAVHKVRLNIYLLMVSFLKNGLLIVIFVFFHYILLGWVSMHTHKSQKKNPWFINIFVPEFVCTSLWPLPTSVVMLSLPDVLACDPFIYINYKNKTHPVICRQYTFNTTLFFSTALSFSHGIDRLGFVVLTLLFSSFSCIVLVCCFWATLMY